MTRGLRLVLVSLVSLAILTPAGGVQAETQDGVAAEATGPPPVAEASPAVDGVSVLRLIRFNGTARGAQGQPLAGVVGVTFALYEEQEGGAPLWLETQNLSLDPKGRYTALLGATSNEGLPLEVFTSAEARWLGIQLQGQAEQRVLLVSVPYALKAAEAETLSGKTASDFILTEQLSTQVEEEINTQIESQGLVTSEDGAALVDGSGTAGRLAKFTTATDIGNSIITEKNGNIGIGFNNPIQKLVVAAGFGGGLALNFTNLVNQDLQVAVSAIDATDKFALFGPSTPTNLALAVGGQEKMRITNAGNVGIGTSTPSERLEVEGDFKVNSQTGGLVIKGNATSPNLIGGFSGNSVAGGLSGATIGGGGASVVTNQITAGNFGTIGGGQENIVSADDATVGGGQGNTASSPQATVGGGLNNSASGGQATVGGGDTNVASGSHATVGGGAGNTASGTHDTVGGGIINTASGTFSTVGGGFQNSAGGIESTIGGGRQNSTHALAAYATVPGGIENLAQGSRSFAAGNRAKAMHDGSFVWGDSTIADVASTAQNQVTFRATGGFRVVMGTTPTELFNLTSTSGASPNLVAGLANSVTGGVKGATISGGGDTAQTSSVTDDFGTVGGGKNNQAGDSAGTTSDKSAATVGGGDSNMASGFASTVGGGALNIASGSSAAVGGGFSNTSNGTSATVAGGTSNFAGCTGTEIVQPCVGLPIALDATVPGGNSNHALGSYSFAAGRRAKARHAGAFVWADSTAADMASSAANQFIVRASGEFFFQSDSTLDDQGGFINTSTGGFLSTGGVWTDSSDAALKENFAPADPEAILARLATMPVQRWNYKAESPDVRRLGPTAQDFYAAFGLGTDDKHIGGVDAHGVAFAAIQALYRVTREQEEQIRHLKAELETLKAQLQDTGAVQVAFAPEDKERSPR